MVFLAQRGDPYARTVLLVRNRSFVKKTATGFCNRVLQWNEDRELEVAINAFDEAIDIFPRQNEDGFLCFAQKVIYLRIKEHFEREGEQDSQSFHGRIDENVADLLLKPKGENKRGGIDDLWEKHKDVLAQYGISYEDLFGCKDGQCEPGRSLAVIVRFARSTLKKYWQEITEAGA
jgi:RNA polymerase sigma factor